MTEFKTPFGILGVDRRTTDAELEAVWLKHVTEAHGEDRVPPDIRDAYGILKDAQLRARFVNLLDACARKITVPVDPDQIEGLKNFCARVGISVFQVEEKHENWLQFRLPGQKPPRKGFRSPWDALKANIIDAMTLQVFRGKSAGAQTVLVLVYIIVVASIWFAFRSVMTAVRESSARSLAGDIRSLHAGAADDYHELEKERAKFAADFLAVTGVPIADSDARQRPRELDLALIRHETVRDFWADIHNAKISDQEMELLREKLSAIETHIRDLTFLETDRERLREVGRAIGEKRASVAMQGARLGHIRKMLAADHFESAGLH
jgi:hypothetical protein